MQDLLVVVATHNGAEHLPRFLGAVNHPYPLLVVDTGSTDTRSIDLLGILQTEDRADFKVTQTPYHGYETGAYLWAYWNYPAKHYLFLQDSMVPREKYYAQQFIANLLPKTLGGEPRGIIAWSGFAMMWDSLAQEQATSFHYPGSIPPRGIFGSIFYTSRATLDHMNKLNLLPMPPATKLMAQGTERAWAILAARAGVPVTYLNAEHDRRAMEAGEFPIFTKYFGGRT